MRLRAGSLLLVAALLAGCGGGDERGADPPPPAPTEGGAVATEAPAGTAALGAAPTTKPPASKKPPAAVPRAGNPNGKASVPAEGRAVDTSKPDRVVGNGTPASCTSKAVVSAVAAGGIITFSCGPDPITITMAQTAKIKNSTRKVVIDGGGKVTLSGGGKRRIIYQNTCDEAQGWENSDCTNQDHPHLTVQNITLADGSSIGVDPDIEVTNGGGGGALYVRGGRFKVVNTKFVRNKCDSGGPDLGGAAIRALDQNQDLPVYVVSSTFGGASGQGGRCSNGGALSSIGVSWIVLNSLFSYNEAIGYGANQAANGTPGGGNGGAMYFDGNTITVRVAGTIMERNHAREGGGAIFFVSNDLSGSLKLENSTLRRNPSDEFETLPGIFYRGTSKLPSITGPKPT
ncbi:hypothetical protein RB614_22080 [Phytohabitans sp. ZYX-F-186]|uniref:Right handed beta helix domain-containing protein n=1 Tax=Phytohabitans maris TaxID=3071409 RepID=A0ABU0ZKX6_9ACTN|nr:hypothetical protein [Phytohabitans sp. ZYX-F-186]MDQ7907206.1 hypothetical protein [Phytohabitans sp. ZYX-F-186]